MAVITRYAYINTRSERGRPTRVEFDSLDVQEVRRWHNINGNPSYTIHLRYGARYWFPLDGVVSPLVIIPEGNTTFFCVDDYGGMNDIYHISAYEVDRRKDLFNGWVYS